MRRYSVNVYDVRCPALSGARCRGSASLPVAGTGRSAKETTCNSAAAVVLQLPQGFERCVAMPPERFESRLADAAVLEHGDTRHLSWCVRQRWRVFRLWTTSRSRRCFRPWLATARTRTSSAGRSLATSAESSARVIWSQTSTEDGVLPSCVFCAMIW